ncbi:hypothetical protein T261_5179 [Streptomyces lydicus]|nr:hypothetical protein T261_5179 [Streptomyces lydicus]
MHTGPAVGRQIRVLGWRLVRGERVGGGRGALVLRDQPVPGGGRYRRRLRGRGGCEGGGEGEQPRGQDRAGARPEPPSGRPAPSVQRPNQPCLHTSSFIRRQRRTRVGRERCTVHAFPPTGMQRSYRRHGP